jgi:hypothetical protein
MVRILASLLGGAAVVVSACSSGSNGASPNADAGADATLDAPAAAVDSSADASTALDAAPDASLPDIPAFCAGVYGSLLTTTETCCSPADRTHGSYAFLDAVLHILVNACEGDLPARVAAGRVRFDPMAAAACIAAEQASLAGHTCSTPVTITLVAACAPVFVGLQAAGAPCGQDVDCQDGLTCIGWTASGVDGSCQPPPAVPQACGEGKGDGGGPPIIPWGFGSHPDCASGGYCAGSPGGACATQSGSGGACTNDTQCTTGLVCHMGKCGTTGPAPANGACASGPDCQPGLYCAPANTCQPQKAAGAPCTGVFDPECKGQCVVPDAGAPSCASYCGSG